MSQSDLLKHVFFLRKTGNGECTGVDTCTCNEGWSGAECQIPSCEDVNNCSDQGDCIGYNTCQCLAGWDGVKCSLQIAENSDTPSFTEEEYASTVVENSPMGTSVLTLQANDSDTGRNGEVTYSIAGGSDAFTIDANTGKISTRLVFDLEAENQPTEYALVAVAEDKGTPVLSSTTDVLITIQDVNDNFPEVNDIENNVQFHADNEAGTLITHVSATDADPGLNGQLVYGFYQASDMITSLFDINSDNGTIVSMDVLSGGEYNIAVEISDHGDPPRSIQTVVTVQVLTAPHCPSIRCNTEYYADITFPSAPVGSRSDSEEKCLCGMLFSVLYDK